MFPDLIILFNEINISVMYWYFYLYLPFFPEVSLALSLLYAHLILETCISFSCFLKSKTMLAAIYLVVWRIIYLRSGIEIWPAFLIPVCFLSISLSVHIPIYIYSGCHSSFPNNLSLFGHWISIQDLAVPVFLPSTPLAVSQNTEAVSQSEGNLLEIWRNTCRPLKVSLTWYKFHRFNRYVL